MIAQVNKQQVEFSLEKGNLLLPGARAATSAVDKHHPRSLWLNAVQLIVEQFSGDGGIQRLLILLLLMCRCAVDLKRSVPAAVLALCLVERLVTRARHMRKLLAFISWRITAITSCSLRPNCNSMASKVVRSSHAISMILSISLSERLFTMSVAFPTLLSYGKCANQIAHFEFFKYRNNN